jgi:hypothetical protein
MKYVFTILIIGSLFFTTRAQKPFTPKYTFNVELGLPVAASNAPFKDYMQGLVSAAVYQQYSFPFHLNIGAGIKYSYFAVNEFSVPSPVYGGVHTGGAFVKVGYDKFHGERFATDFGVKFGYAENYITTDVNQGLGVDPIRIPSSYIEPAFSLILTADPRNSYRFNIGYTILGYGFKPTMLGLASNGAFEESKLSNVTQYLLVGFGYTFYFGVKQSD